MKYSSIQFEDAIHMVGKGWSDLIRECYDICQNDKIVKETGFLFVTQVKEKFGGLRFYVDGISEESFDKLWEIEQKSYTICENCGKPGKVRNFSGWYKTSCDDCAKEK